MVKAASGSPVKRYVRRLTSWGLEPYRAATSSVRELPNFIIIGVQKGGTTSLYNYLTQHPNVNHAFDKELHFFDKRFDQGVGWYRSRFPFRQQSCITGEASPNYIYYPGVPERIAKIAPHAKLIALLRHPVDRAYSNYNHNLRANANLRKKGLPEREPLTFEQAIAAEPGRLRQAQAKLAKDPSTYIPDFTHYSYLAKGVYVDQIQRWHTVFPREQLLILNSEDLSREPSATFGKVLDFLGLPSWEPTSFKSYNTLEYDKMAPETRQSLVEYFKPHNERLSDYLGQHFAWNQ